MFLYPEINPLSQKGTSRTEQEKDFSPYNNPLLCIKMDATTFKILFGKTDIRQVKAPNWEKGKVCFMPLGLSQESVYLKLTFFNLIQSIPNAEGIFALFLNINIVDIVHEEVSDINYLKTFQFDKFMFQI